jgi:hypothetical protein
MRKIKIEFHELTGKTELIVDGFSSSQVLIFLNQIMVSILDPICKAEAKELKNIKENMKQ